MLHVWRLLISAALLAIDGQSQAEGVALVERHADVAYARRSIYIRIRSDNEGWHNDNERAASAGHVGG